MWSHDTPLYAIYCILYNLVRGSSEPVSRDQILRRERGQGFFFFFIFSPVQLTTNRIEDHSAEPDDQ